MSNLLFRKTMIFAITGLFIGISLNYSIGGLTLNNNLKNNSLSSTNYGDLIIYFLDIGQGDSIVIQTPDYNYILIDTGERAYSTRVINFLNDLSVHTLTAFVATHPHADHIGGCEEIFNAFDILSVYEPGYDIDTATYRRFLNAAENEGCPIYTDDDLDPGDYIDISNSVTCQILNINKDASNANDASIVLRIDHGVVSFLFTGDINGDQGDYVESYLVDNWDVDIDILKVSHHGSRHASTDYFLNEATPIISIISCGAGNPYGHPHLEALYRLSQHDSLVYRTDYNGDISVTSDGLSWSILYEKPNDPPMRPTVNGITYGTTGFEHNYWASTSDPNGDKVFYQWDWNDGNISEWMGPYNSGEEIYAFHKWTQDGTYIIKVKARDENYQESDWGMLNVVMPRYREITKVPMLNLFNRFLQLFPIIKWLNEIKLLIIM